MISFLKKYSFTSILVAFFLFLIPFVTSRHLFHGAVNAKLFFVLFSSYIFFAITAYKIYSKEISVSLKKQYFLAGLGVFAIYGFLSSFLGVNSDQSLWSEIIRSTGVLFVTHIILLAFSWSLILSKEEEWTMVRRSIIASSALFGVLYSLGTQGLGLFSGRLFSVNFSTNGLTIGNETFAGAYMFLAVVTTLIELVRSKEKREKTLLYTALFFQVINPLIVNFALLKGVPFSWGNLIGVARASSAAVVLLLGYTASLRLFVCFNKQKLFKFLSIGILLAIIASLASLFISGTKIQEKYIELSTAARILVWDSSLESAKERMLTGFGPENFGVAMQKNFNSNLYLDENLGEVWFDRAHNVFVEIFVTKGILGILVSLLILGLFVRAVYRAHQKGNIGFEESYILYALSVGHILQISTSFDTVITYVFLGFFAGYALYLERLTTEEKNTYYSKYIALGFLVVTIVSFCFVYVPLKIRQNALYDIFTVSTHEKRMKAIEKLDTGALTFEPLRLVSSGIVKGVFNETEKIDQQKQKEILTELQAQDALLVTYVENNPESYRGKASLLYIRFAGAFLGDNRLKNKETEILVADLYELSPNNPLTFILNSLYYVYTGNIKEAESVISHAQELFPKVELVRNVAKYIEVQKKNYPEVTFLILENL